MTPVPFARGGLILAAVLWSTGSLFMRLLDVPTPLGLHEPKLDPLQIAFFRGLFAGLALLPLVRRRDVRFRPIMPVMVATFAVMSGLYLTALGLGKAANAILLQNSAPVWVYLFGVFLLKHASDRRSLESTLAAMVGAAVIVVGNWPWGVESTEQWTQAQILLMAAGSGVAYAWVVLFLGMLKSESPAWLMVLNLLGSAACLAGFVLVTRGWTAFAAWATAPSLAQLAFLALFGIVQMALSYWLFARGLKVVSEQEAGVITLLEPALNPVWAYLIAPEKEVPSVWTWIGGLILLGSLGWRYWPRRTTRPAPVESVDAAPQR